MKSSKFSLAIGWSIWSLAAIFYALDYFQHTAPSVLIEPISSSIGLPVERISYIMSIYFPIYAISQIPAGILLDKLGSRIMLSISCLIMSIGILMFVMDPIIETMLIGRILIAIGSAVAFIGCLKVAADVLPENMFAIAVGVANTIGVVGGIFGQKFLGYLVTELNSWEVALAVIGIFGIIWSIVIFSFLKTSRNNSSRDVLKNVKEYDFKQSIKLLFNKKLILIAIYSGLMVGIVVNAFSELYDVLFLKQVYHVTSHIAENISIMMFVGIAFGGPTHGIIAKVFGEKRTWMLICNIITIIVFSSIISLAQYIPVSLLYILFFIVGFTVSSMLLSFAIVEEIFPQQIRATALAVVNMVIGLCGALFQYLISLISVHLNGGPLKLESIKPGIFGQSFIYLLIPLLLSTLIILYLVIDKFIRNRRPAPLL